MIRKPMIIYILIIGLITVLVGCIVEDEGIHEKNDENGNTIEEVSDVEVISYTVVTQKMRFDKTFENIADGFNYSETAYRYLLRGKLLNNGTQNYSKLYVFVDFYDSNDTLLHQIFDMVFQLSPNEIKDFAVDFTKYDAEGFPNAHHVGFTIVEG